MAMQPEESAPQAPDQSAPSGGVGELVAGIGSNLMKFQDMLSKQYPQEAQKLAAIISQYDSLVQDLSGPEGGQAAPAPQGPGGPADMQAGASPSARPM